VAVAWALWFCADFVPVTVAVLFSVVPFGAGDDAADRDRPRRRSPRFDPALQ
jgi:hypothetical protein